MRRIELVASGARRFDSGCVAQRDALLARLGGLPELIVDDAQLGHLGDDPLGLGLEA